MNTNTNTTTPTPTRPLSIASQLLRDQSERALANDLNHRQLMILLTLDDIARCSRGIPCENIKAQPSNYMTCSELAKISKSSTAAVTGTCDKLKSRGLINRVHATGMQDRRTICISITDAGMDMIEEILAWG